MDLKVGDRVKWSRKELKARGDYTLAHYTMRGIVVDTKHTERGSLRVQVKWEGQNTSSNPWHFAKYLEKETL